MHKKTEATEVRKCDHPEEEVRKEWNCNGCDAKYSFANAEMNEKK